MAVIVVLVVTVAAVAVVNFASRDVAGSIAQRKEAAVTSCVEAGRSLLMSQWKLLGAHGVTVQPLNVLLDGASQSRVQGGHYGDDPSDSAHWNSGTQTWINNVQVIRLDPLTVGSSYRVSDLTNRVGDAIQAYRVVVHCTQADGRQAEVEFAVQYGL